MRLSGKVALVTGAASGIGLAIAQAFAREGARVCVADVNAGGAEAAARELRGLGIVMDVTREDQVDAGVARCARELGGIDVMVSNAGVQHIAALTEFAYADWRRVVAIHLDGGFLLTRACLREMVKQKRGGSLIYMGSVHSKEASPLKAAYVAAKHGLLGPKFVAGHGVWLSNDELRRFSVPGLDLELVLVNDGSRYKVNDFVQIHTTVRTAP